MTDSSRTFRRQKWRFIIRFLAGGLALGLAWTLWAQIVLHEDYPYTTILANPAGRFADFTDDTIFACMPNPYVDPTAIYSPVALVLYRTASFSDNISLILLYFLCLSALALLLIRVLEPIIPGAWARVSLAYLFLAISYPVLFCLDRGNLEILMAPLIGWGLYFYNRHRDLAGSACLTVAISLKFYPALLLILLLRRGKLGLFIASGLCAVALGLACTVFFQASPYEMWTCFRHNLAFYRDAYLLDNPAIQGSSSPWNAFKIVLLAVQDTGMIKPIDFGFEGPFIRAAYFVYSSLLALFTLGCIGYAWIYERQQSRGILILLLLISIALPSGPDYRLLYASMALVLLACLPDHRRGDWLALTLLALAVIPKKEIILDFIGKTESRFADVPVQALINPIFLCAAITVLLSQSGPFDRQRALRRIRHLLPRRWRRPEGQTPVLPRV